MSARRLALLAAAGAGALFAVWMQRADAAAGRVAERPDELIEEPAALPIAAPPVRAGIPLQAILRARLPARAAAPAAAPRVRPLERPRAPDGLELLERRVMDDPRVGPLLRAGRAINLSKEQEQRLALFLLPRAAPSSRAPWQPAPPPPPDTPAEMQARLALLRELDRPLQSLLGADLARFQSAALRPARPEFAVRHD